MSWVVQARRLWVAGWTVVLLLGLGGCSTTFSESYYVGVMEGTSGGLQETTDDQYPPLQLYRFDLAGSSSLGCKTRFESGFFDAGAVDTLFGEISDKGTKSPPRNTTVKLMMRFGPEGIEEVANDQTRLVVFMSSDPEVITRRIKSLVNQRAAQVSLADILAAPDAQKQESQIQGVQGDLDIAKAAAGAMEEAMRDKALNENSLTLLRQQWLTASSPAK